MQSEIDKPCTPTLREVFEKPALTAEELETEVGECEEWDEASYELTSPAVVGPIMRWVESILGAW
jgi:hypothetical protein